MSTDVDVLRYACIWQASASCRIRRQADVDVARAALNDAIGLPLDASHTLTSQLVPLDSSGFSGYSRKRKTAIGSGPRLRQAKLAISLAETQVATARSALLPQVTLHGAFESIVSASSPEAGDNWLISIGLRWNLFIWLQRQSADRREQVCRWPQCCGRGARGLCHSTTGSPGLRGPECGYAANRSGQRLR
jgi:outer membrane protein TolC